MSRPQSVTFRGKRWRVIWRRPVPFDGQAEHVGFSQKRIYIDPNLKGCEMLETLIHEAMHAADWSTDEEYVDADAHELTTWLWRNGVRIGHEQEKG